MRKPQEKTITSIFQMEGRNKVKIDLGLGFGITNNNVHTIPIYTPTRTEQLLIPTFGILLTLIRIEYYEVCP